MTEPRLEVSRGQILAFRRRVGGLDERRPAGSASLRQAAWAGLQDSMPRAALLSIHARVNGTTPSTWEDPSLVQLWGPRYSAYVVPADAIAPFTLGRLPTDEKGRRRASLAADRLEELLAGRRLTYGEAGRALGVNANSLRYGAPTGRILMRWDGARQPVVWTVPAPDVEPLEARIDLARRYLHVFGPSTDTAFARWAGIKPPAARAAFAALQTSLTPVRTPIGEAWILGTDEEALREAAPASASARLLPSGDAYFLLQGTDRELLVPEPERRPLLWTSRVWPGAVLLGGEIIGTWRRADALVTVEPWQALTSRQRADVEAEAGGLPLPGLDGPIRVRWAR